MAIKTGSYLKEQPFLIQNLKTCWNVFGRKFTFFCWRPKI